MMIISEVGLLKFLKKFKNWKGGVGVGYFKLSKSRNSKIMDWMVGLNVVVYNGKIFIPVKVVKTMVNRCLGAFSFAYSIWVKKKKKNIQEKVKQKLNNNGAFSKSSNISFI